MGLIQIRNVPEDVHRTLKARAAARGSSLSDYVLVIWTVLVGWEGYELKRHFTCSAKDIGITAFGAFSILYVVSLLAFGRTTKDKTKGAKPGLESGPDASEGVK